jgi:hypothetical protein
LMSVVKNPLVTVFQAPPPICTSQDEDNTAGEPAGVAVRVPVDPVNTLIVAGGFLEMVGALPAHSENANDAVDPAQFVNTARY